MRGQRLIILPLVSNSRPSANTTSLTSSINGSEISKAASSCVCVQLLYLSFGWLAHTALLFICSTVKSSSCMHVLCNPVLACLVLGKRYSLLAEYIEGSMASLQLNSLHKRSTNCFARCNISVHGCSQSNAALSTSTWNPLLPDSQMLKCVLGILRSNSQSTNNLA